MSVLEVDTKGTCLFCLTSNCSPPHKNIAGEMAQDSSNLDSSSAAFKMLLRYLNVDLRKLNHFPGALHPFLNMIKLSVPLCQECCSVTGDFFELFQAFEGIRLQLDLCVKQIHEFMEKGWKDPVRVGEYKRRAETGNEEDMVDFCFAEELRKETVEKCSLQTKSTCPQIVLVSKGFERTQDKSVQTAPDDVQVPTSIEPVEDNRMHDGEDDRLSFGEPDQVQLPDDDDVEMSEPGEPEPRNTSDNTDVQLDGGEHTLSKTDNGNNKKCKHCEQQFEEEAALLRHVLRFHTNPAGASVQCIHCGKRFNQPESLSTHLILKHTMIWFSDRVPPNCSEQQVKSSLSRILNNDVKKIPEGDQVLFQCAFCRKQWKKRKEVKAHLLRNHFEKVVNMSAAKEKDKNQKKIVNVKIIREDCDQNQTKTVDNSEDHDQGQRKIVIIRVQSQSSE